MKSIKKLLLLFLGISIVSVFSINSSAIIMLNASEECSKSTCSIMVTNQDGYSNQGMVTINSATYDSCMGFTSFSDLKEAGCDKDL